MSFSHAKAKVLREGSTIRLGELASPVNLSPPMLLGVSGGEVVGGSVAGHVDFLTPGRGAASTVGSAVDSVEKMFSQYNQARSEVGVKTEKGAMKLIFPLYDQDEGLEEQRPWSVCTGLVLHPPPVYPV